MLECKVLVRKAGSTVDATGPCPIAFDKVSALYHEILDLVPGQSILQSGWDLVGNGAGDTTYHAMELGVLVALRFASAVFALAGAELAEILCGFGHCVGEEFHFDTAQWFAWLLDLMFKMEGTYQLGLYRKR